MTPIQRNKTATALAVLILILALSGGSAFAHVPHESYDFFRLFENHGSVMLIIDGESGAILHANQAAMDFYGYGEKQILAMNIRDINTLTEEEVARERQAALREDRNFFEFSHRLADGEVRQVEVYSYPFVAGGRSLLYSIVQDVTEQKTLEAYVAQRNRISMALLGAFILAQSGIIFLLVRSNRENKKIQKSLAASQKEYRSLFDNMAEGFALHEMVMDEGGNPVDYRFLTVNRAFERLTGLSKEQVEGKSLVDVLPGSDREWVEEYAKVVQTGKPIRIERFSNALGRHFSIHAFSPEPGRFATIFFDISGTVERQREIEYLSYHDYLTGLYNRRFFEEEIRRLDTSRNLPLSVVYADVNGLKLTNDAFGHAAGDELLKETARVLREACRIDDILARMGGDEFALLLPGTGSGEAERIVERIQLQAASVRLESGPLSVSFGWDSKLYPEESMDEIMRRAENHMYRRKLSEGPGVRGKAVKIIMNTLYEKHQNEKAHSERVSELCGRIGKALGLPTQDINELKAVGIFHDIGKIAISEAVLNKQEELTEEEWAEIRRHAETGHRILGSAGNLAELSEYVLAHHERWDGKGYPKGLKGKEIPLQARIIALADAYDAMITARPYKPALSREEALEQIRRGAGTQFDPHIADILITLLSPKRDT